MTTTDRKPAGDLAIARPVAIEVLAGRTGYDSAKIDLVRRTVAKGTDDNELELFLQFCLTSGLDPLSRMVYAIKRWDSRAGREVMAIQVGIDGFRAIAQDSGEYDGQEGPHWCGEDGEWKDVWTARGVPVACRVGIYRKGQSRPIWGVITYAEFCQRGKDGKPSGLWGSLPTHMMAVRAESHALRKAIPRKLGHITLMEAPIPESVIEEARHPRLPRPGGKPSTTAAQRAIYAADYDEEAQQVRLPKPGERPSIQFRGRSLAWPDDDDDYAQVPEVETVSADPIEDEDSPERISLADIDDDTPIVIDRQAELAEAGDEVDRAQDWIELYAQADTVTAVKRLNAAVAQLDLDQSARDRIRAAEAAAKARLTRG